LESRAHRIFCSQRQEAKTGKLERLTQEGTVPPQAYRAIRDAHYQALAAVMALKALGYSIREVGAMLSCSQKAAASVALYGRFG
jgi:Holliday junction resolvasome RuvABC DNA-binding subunit